MSCVWVGVFVWSCGFRAHLLGEIAKENDLFGAVSDVPISSIVGVGTLLDEIVFGGFY